MAAGEEAAREVRVLIVDDHAVFRAGLKALIAQEDDLECVGEAGSAEEAVAKARRLEPDVVVLDLRMPGDSGISATRRIVESRPGTGVLLLTMHDDEDSVIAAMRAGARGYVLKGSSEDNIMRAIRAVADGEAIFGPAVARQILQLFAGTVPSRAERAFPELSAREREVLEQLARGSSNGQIALRLGLSTKTVRNNVSTICNKLQVVDRAQAALRARDAGLGRADAR